MDKSKRGGLKKSLLLLLISYLTSQRCRFVEAASDDQLTSLIKNQAFLDDPTDPRTKFVSSLSHLIEQDQEGKRSSSFFPLRGKKIPNSEPYIADHYQFMPDSEDKRSQFFPLRGKKVPSDLKRASSFMPMRGRKNDEWDEFDESQDKRASSFMPMRGKKRSEATMQHFGKSGMYDSVMKDLTLPSSSGSSIETKRASSFVPTRGKKMDQTEKSSEKTNDTQIDALRNKRGVFKNRVGRKLLSESDSSEDIGTNLLKKKYHSFVPMRGRRSLFSGDSDIDGHYLANDLDASYKNLELIPPLNLLDKKASFFMPMRGRRDSDVYKYFDMLPPKPFDKRKMSFTAMRGKRDFKTDESLAADDKRASSFMPMRGKKDYDNDSNVIDDLLDMDDKRASSFMPMRGKKDYDAHPDFDADFIEDKRASSFMAMRGKKAFLNHSHQLSDSIDDKRASSFMPMRGRRSIETVDFDGNANKRASSFMPMRGRRSMSEFSDGRIDSFDDKRASSFMPMRGRKSHETEGYENANKRASSFMPMRGRRSMPQFREGRTTNYRDTQFTPDYSRRLLSNNLDGDDNKQYVSMPLRDRQYSTKNDSDEDFYLESNEYVTEKRGYAFMPMRGRRDLSQMDDTNLYYTQFPFFIPAGIGSALIARPFANRDILISSLKAALSNNRRQYDWDSVKRAFHATRGKRLSEDFREDNAESDSREDEKEESGLDSIENFRLKRNVFQTPVSFKQQRKYIALKRPMSFFATRGKRFDDSSSSLP